MQISVQVLLCAALIAVSAPPQAVRADEATAAVAMPQRERDLIAIVEDARRQLRTNHGPTPAQDARMAMQIHVMSFMRQSQAAQDWIGTVKTHGTNPEGDAWISIEIGDDILFSTWQTERDDLNSSTLLKPHSKQFAVAQSAKIGQPITFSGLVLKSVLGADDAMVLNPQFIVRFGDLKLGQ